VSLVQRALQSVASEFHFSNVIDRPHFCAIRRDEKNPTPEELLSNWEQFEHRLKRMNIDCIVAFGSNVRGAFARADGIEYLNGRIYKRGNETIIFAPHPSFVMIYKRKKMSSYIRSLSRLISDGTTLRQDLGDTKASQAV
jgi:uracil-DNA glycosylase